MGRNIVALIVMGYAAVSGQQQLSAIQSQEYVYIAIGSIMVMFVAQAICFFGVRASNMTTMALTMLAFLFISQILELIVGLVHDRHTPGRAAFWIVVPLHISRNLDLYT